DHSEGVPRADVPGDRGTGRLPAEHSEDAALSGPHGSSPRAGEEHQSNVMTETACTFPGDRDEALVTYLYDDESDAAAHAVFEAHLATCVRCVDDLAALRGVRTRLARWPPPEPTSASRSQQSAANPQSTINPPPAIRNPQWWRAIPAWAQVAAALVFLGVAAGVANLDIRHDSNGLSVRTGW